MENPSDVSHLTTVNTQNRLTLSYQNLREERRLFSSSSTNQTVAEKTVEMLGQSLVLSKLARLGYVCSTTPTNAESVDIVGYHSDTKRPLLVQVKTKSTGNWQLDARDFLDMDVIHEKDGRYRHVIRGPRPIPLDCGTEIVP